MSSGKIKLSGTFHIVFKALQKSENEPFFSPPPSPAVMIRYCYSITTIVLQYTFSKKHILTDILHMLANIPQMLAKIFHMLANIPQMLA